MKIVFAFLIINLSVYGFVHAQDEVKGIDSLLVKCTDNAEFSGTVLVARNGKVLFNKGYGYRNVEQKMPNDENTIFNIASITKTFTAALILKLQEQGKLAVTDALSKYYPGYPNGEAITIHQLLTHTSGIHNYTEDNDFQMMDQTKALTLEEMVAFFKSKPTDFAPGAKFHYSNSGYTLLGYIIEKVTGMSYAGALERYILKPLHMNHTSFGPSGEVNGQLATGYMAYYSNFKKPSYRVHPSISYATGAIYSTVNDLYKWHQALQKNKFLSEKSLASAYKKDKFNYGYGWFTDSLYGKQRVSHDGSIAGYKSNINRFPQDDICVIALSNASNSSVGGIVRNIVNILYHQPLPKPFAEMPVIQMADSVKSEYIGIYKYRKEDSIQVAVYVKDNNLFVAIGSQPAFEILPVFKDIFKSGEARIEFKRDNGRKVKQVWLFNKGEIAQVTKLD